MKHAKQMKKLDIYRKAQKIIQTSYISIFSIYFIIACLNAEDLTIFSIKFWIIFAITGILTYCKMSRINQ